MKIFVFCALALLVTILVAMGVMTRIRYRIGSRHVKVLLFGICIRRVALVNVESVSKRPGAGWIERWWSTMHPSHRLLFIRRKRGLVKNFAITPKNRYVFKSDLERAMTRVGNPPSTRSEPPDEDSQTDTTVVDSPAAKAALSEEARTPSSEV